MKHFVRKHVRQAVVYPHQYFVAAMLTFFSVSLGETRLVGIGLLWLYALGENYGEQIDRIVTRAINDIFPEESE